ncbi:MAG: hypothetical protein R3282_05050, partial [Rhodothermales bacterium]|nr:hypothetical protein [Rhodothermales bacterium]
MKRSHAAARRIFSLVATSAALTGCNPTAAEVDLAIVGATVFDATGSEPILDAAILIAGGVIQAVGPSASFRIGADAELIDATGKFVIPGLTDSHVHFGTGANVPGEPDQLLGQFLSYGITAVLNLGATAGDVATIRELQGLVAEDPTYGPEIYATGGLLTVPGSHPTSTIMRPPSSGD